MGLLYCLNKSVFLSLPTEVITMKKILGLLMMMGLMVSFVGCATNVEKGDELAQQGKYEEAIKLYELVKSEDEEYGKAQENIAQRLNISNKH